MQQITEQRRLLETGNVLRLSLPQQHAASSSSQGRVSTLMRERDDLQQRLRATELVRSAAETRFETAESSLQRAMEDLNGKRRDLEQSAAASVAARKREEDELRQELVSAEASRCEAERALARKKGQIEGNEHEQQEVRIERDALAEANETLARDIADVRDRIESEKLRFRTCEAESAELQVQMRMREIDTSNEVNTVRRQVQNLEDDVRNTLSSWECTEAATTRDRLESVETQCELDAMLAARGELQSKKRCEAEACVREAEELHARAEKLTSDRAQVARRLSEVQTATRQLQEQEKTEFGRSELAARNLARERNHAEELRAKAQSEVLAAKRRVDALEEQLRENQQQNLDLAREIAVAHEAMEEAAGTPWSAGPPIDRRILDHRPQVERGRAVELQRELDQLQRWKGDAMGLLQRMQQDMASVQDQYRQQVEHSQELQERLERLGMQARIAVSSVPGVQPTVPGAPNAQPVPPPYSQNTVGPCWPPATHPSTEPISAAAASHTNFRHPWGMNGSLHGRPDGSFLNDGMSAPGFAAASLSDTGLIRGANQVVGNVLPAGPDMPERADISVPAVRAVDMRPGGGACACHSHINSGIGMGPLGGATLPEARKFGAGPDIPERSDLPSHMRTPDFQRPLSKSWDGMPWHRPGVSWNSASGDLRSSSGSNNRLDDETAFLAASLQVPSPGPVGGPFYDVFRTRATRSLQQTTSARLSGSFPRSGTTRRRRRSVEPARRSSGRPCVPTRSASATGFAPAAVNSFRRGVSGRGRGGA